MRHNAESADTGPIAGSTTRDGCCHASPVIEPEPTAEAMLLLELEPTETPASLRPSYDQGTGLGVPPRPARPSAIPSGRTRSAASTGTAPGVALDHLRAVMLTGADQRRYVEDLPARTGKGTFVKLPIHLQDVLREYCNRYKGAPQQDLIAAILDAYFRDLGALPPLGTGHRPVDEFFDDLRDKQRGDY